MNIYRATPEVEFVERCLRDWCCDRFPVQLDHPLIAVRDQDDTAVIGIHFKRCAEYCNNLHPKMACIHSDPYFGHIDPECAVTARGKIIFFDGSVADFMQSASAPHA